ncbi:hypothetical protein L3Q82_014853, partial [Scortum barcoo]
SRGMSRADWTFLEHLLEEGQEYSTGVGRVWLTVLFLFRILVLGTAAESAWDDEQADFVCNTRQPGCTAVCYDKAFPISHFRYFVLQVIFVSTPTIFYFGYVAIRAAKGSDKEQKDNEQVRAEEGGDGSKRGETAIERDNNNRTKVNAEEKEKREQHDGKGRKAEKAPTERPKLKGRLLCAYAFSIPVKTKFECRRFPCPQTVDCFVSRPTEKTIFTIYTQVMAAVSLLLNLIELLHLLQLAISHRLEKRYRTQHQHHLPRSAQVMVPQQAPELQVEASYIAGSHVDLPTQGGAACYPKPCESYGDLAIEGMWCPSSRQTALLFLQKRERRLQPVHSGCRIVPP